MHEKFYQSFFFAAKKFQIQYWAVSKILYMTLTTFFHYFPYWHFLVLEFGYTFWYILDLFCKNIDTCVRYTEALTIFLKYKLSSFLCKLTVLKYPTASLSLRYIMRKNTLLNIKLSDKVLVKNIRVNSLIDIIYFFLPSITLLKIIILQLWLYYCC